MNITMADVLKVLGLIAMALTVVAGLLQTIKPSLALILTGIAAAIYAFVNKVGHQDVPVSVVPKE